MEISVVMPIYNGAKYVEEAIQSVLNQPYKDVEVICIDDGSNDNSVSIISAIALRDPRVSIYQQKHEGVAVARNKGLELAQGEYVAFLDQDDVWTKNAITADLMVRITKESCDVVAFSYYDADSSLIRGCLHEVNDGVVKIKELPMQHHSAYFYKKEF